ncbi:hypothetical protein DERF_008905 [Dermatophagoides farinae]|uniref:Transmembrane protein n=1 Tax=Dermatophagoides farinae TaxID=6954 RepID=A0A922I6Q4_DERFA|nr:hypothetical protein DERF_008905 [Dermatophagoides farinae]
MFFIKVFIYRCLLCLCFSDHHSNNCVCVSVCICVKNLLTNHLCLIYEQQYQKKRNETIVNKINGENLSNLIKIEVFKMQQVHVQVYTNVNHHSFRASKIISCNIYNVLSQIFSNQIIK